MVSKEDILCFFFVNDIVFAFKKKNQPNVKEIVNALKRKFRLEELGEFKWFFKIYILKNHLNSPSSSNLNFLFKALTISLTFGWFFFLKAKTISFTKKKQRISSLLTIYGS